MVLASLGWSIRDAALLQFLRVLGLEQEVKAQRGQVAAPGLARLGHVDDHALGAPDVGDAILVVRVVFGGLRHHARVQKFLVGNLRPIDGLKHPGLDLLGHVVGAGVDHVVAAVAAEQLGLQRVVAVQDAVDHLDAGCLLELGYRLRPDVLRPVQHFQGRLRLRRPAQDHR